MAGKQSKSPKVSCAKKKSQEVGIAFLTTGKTNNSPTKKKGESRKSKIKEKRGPIQVERGISRGGKRKRKKVEKVAKKPEVRIRGWPLAQTRKTGSMKVRKGSISEKKRRGKFSGLGGGTQKSRQVHSGGKQSQEKKCSEKKDGGGKV